MQQTDRRHAWTVRTTLVVLLVALATVGTLGLQRVFQFQNLSLYFAAVAVGATCGLFPGLLATALSAVAVHYILPATYVSNIYDEAVRLAAFTVVALLISWLAGRRRAAELALRELNAELESRVRERTAELERTARRLREESEERARIAAEREQNLEYVRRALHHAPLPAAIHAEDGEVVTVNRTWTELTGFDPGELRTVADWLRLAYPGGHEHVLPAVEQIFAVDDRTEIGEFVITTADGRQRVWDYTSAPLGRDAGGRRLAVSMAVDVTARKEAETALRESEQRFRELANHAPVLIWLADTDKNVNFVNEAWVAYTGRTEAEELGDGWCDNVHPDDMKRCYDTYTTAFDAREAFEMEYRLRRHDGQYRWILDRGVPLFRGGAFTGFLGSAIDINDRRELEEQRLRLAEEQLARERATAANKAKDELIAVLSHELRTPLTPVMLVVEAMKDDPRLPEEVRQDLAMVERNLKLEVHLIDDLLDVTRIRKEKLPLEFSTVDAHDLIRQAHQTIRPDLEGRKLDVALHLGAEQRHVRAEARRLQQVFWNLLKNAIKFTPDGGHIEVRTSNTPEGNFLAEIVDTGIGIEEEALRRIFDAFEQGEPQEHRRYGGLGLGLAICKAMVDMHGGSISATSLGKNRGATFTVELTTVPPEPPPAEPPREAAPRGERIGRRILLVEDDNATSTVMKRLLAEMGHEVTSVSNVQDALKAAERGPVDLVVSDLGLPDGNGIELMQQLRERHGLRGIAISGYGMEQDVRQSLEAGFVNHITKPVTIKKIEDAIQEACC